MAKSKKAPLMTKTGEIIDKAFIVRQLDESDAWLYRGLLAIYNRQTADEQAAEATSHDNGIGFNGADARFLTSLAKGLKKYGRLTPSQITFARKKMTKYAGQLLRIAEETRGAA